MSVFLLSRHFCSLLICIVALSVISYGGPQLSRQNQKPHGKNKNITAKPKTSRQKHHGKTKIPHSKTKNLTAKTKYLMAKPNTSLQEQIALVLPWVFAFAVRYLVFAVYYLVLP